MRGASAASCKDILRTCGAEAQALTAASVIKRLAGQVNVAVHALGVLLCLPHLLEPSEVIAYVSLGAGNTGRAFDLETNRRVAEFKFIGWRGGSESIRQNALFKDFFFLAEYEGRKSRFLYVLGTEYPLKFLNGGRALSSVLSRNDRLKQLFEEKYGHRYATVGEYYTARKTRVVIQDVSRWVSDLLPVATADETVV